MAIQVIEGQRYVVCHRNEEGEPMDVVEPVFTTDGELVGWKSVVTGLYKSLACEGYEEEYRDCVVPLPDQGSSEWQQINL